MQAGSCESQENNLSDQSELRELRRSAQRVRSPLSCLSRVSPLALIAQVVLLILFAASLALASGLAVTGAISPVTSKEPELTAEMSSLAALMFPGIS
jgi:hypothetical protein